MRQLAKMAEKHLAAAARTNSMGYSRSGVRNVLLQPSATGKNYLEKLHSAAAF